MRKKYLDGLKTIAIFIVFATHFIDYFNIGPFEQVVFMPLALFFRGFTGKLGVTIFSVILGYFAYQSSEKNIVLYSAKRYIYFFLCALFVNILYGACGFMIGTETTYTVSDILRETALLSDAIYPTFWCIERFFIASVLSRINGRAGLGAGAILVEIGILIWWGHIWTAICVMGNIAAAIEKNDYFNRASENRVCRASFYMITFILINIPESKTSYIISGICITVIVAMLAHSILFKKVLETQFLSLMGKNTMAIFMIHEFVYQLVGSSILNDFGDFISFSLSLIMAFIISWLSIVLISVPLTQVISRLYKTVCKPIEALAESFSKNNISRHQRTE